MKFFRNSNNNHQSLGTISQNANKNGNYLYILSAIFNIIDNFHFSQARAYFEECLRYDACAKKVRSKQFISKSKVLFV